MYLIVNLVFPHLGFWSGNLFLIAPFSDLCLLVSLVYICMYVINDNLQTVNWKWNVAGNPHVYRSSELYFLRIRETISEMSGRRGHASTNRNVHKDFFVQYVT